MKLSADGVSLERLGLELLDSREALLCRLAERFHVLGDALGRLRSLVGLDEPRREVRVGAGALGGDGGFVNLGKLLAVVADAGRGSKRAELREHVVALLRGYLGGGFAFLLGVLFRLAHLLDVLFESVNLGSLVLQLCHDALDPGLGGRSLFDELRVFCLSLGHSLRLRSLLCLERLERLKSLVLHRGDSFQFFGGLLELRLNLSELRGSLPGGFAHARLHRGDGVLVSLLRGIKRGLLGGDGFICGLLSRGELLVNFGHSRLALRRLRFSILPGLCGSLRGGRLRGGDRGGCAIARGLQLKLSLVLGGGDFPIALLVGLLHSLGLGILCGFDLGFGLLLRGVRALAFLLDVVQEPLLAL
mmetsp:Transcript_2492/g.10685  ORF Transcript_2492/g.10685 Transcript_2492/m.10685 type:complete len:360 (+) Transcript_2492:1260-2339(+)